MKSRVLIGISDSFRFAITDTSEIFGKMIENDKYPEMFLMPEILLLNLVSLMSSDIKGEKKKITAVLKTGGLFDSIKARIDGKGRVISNTVILKDKMQKLLKVKTEKDFLKLYKLGEGVLKIEVDLGLKTPYYSELRLEDNENLDDVIKRYYKDSNQINTLTNTSIENSTKRVGSYLIQCLPNYSEENFELIKNKLNQIYSIGELLHQGFSLEKIAALIFEDIREDKLGQNIEDFKILEIRDLIYECDCSREKYNDIIKNVYSKEEIDDIIKKEGKVEAVCGFCDSYYLYKEIK